MSPHPPGARNAASMFGECVRDCAVQTGLRLLVVAWTSLVGCSPSQPSVQCPEPAVAAASASEAAAVDEHPAASPLTRVFVVRHAEKADDGTRNPPLLPEGAVRASCLAEVLGGVEVTHVFATDLRRTALTVTPLAAAKALEVQTFPASDTESLAAALRALPSGSVAVVAGHSNTIPNLADLLGASVPGLNDKGNIPEQDYDRLLELVLAEGVAAAPALELRYCQPSAAAL
ncbi:MAG: histidine phosphatase family protein [Nannocystaceae bacterium]|nr:histidine phosphatase family protein [Nannocystaceae bacterium]